MDKDFELYLKNERENFMQHIGALKPSIPMVFRTEMESFVIAYDQAVSAINQTHWIKIEGEDSLPKDDEVLCVFAILYKDGRVSYSSVNSWADFKKSVYYQIQFITHYTIINPPKQ